MAFDPTYSSDKIWVGEDYDLCLTDDLADIKSDIAALETGKSNTNHTHTEYAPFSHTHTGYATATDVSELQTLVGDTSVSSQISSAVSGKANTDHTHSGYAAIIGSNEFNGEQKFTNSQYCGTLNDTANGVGCAFKASRALVNEALVDKLVITSTTGQIPIYTYGSISNGSITNLTRVGYIDSSGNAVFNGTVSATNIQDSVVEQGTVGNMRYQKWSSGKSEAWYYENLGEVALTTSMAGGVWSNTSCNGRVVNFPSGLFIDKPIAVSNVYSDGYTFSQVAGADRTRMIYRIWSSYSITISSTEISIYVVGKWK